MAEPRYRALPLRVGLVAAMLLLVACGLLASGVAVTSILRHTLVNRVDESLADASSSWAQEPRQELLPDAGPNPARPPSNFYVQGVDTGGDVWMAINDRKAQPALPDSNDVGSTPVTVGSVGDSGVRWRAVSVRGSNGELITVAIDLSDVQSTVRSLIWLQIAIGAAVLVQRPDHGPMIGCNKLEPMASG